MTQSPHGTQIEYHRKDGKAFLWYPGNWRIVPSNWKVKTYAGTSHEICWQYPSSSRNGLTGLSSGGRFQCTPGFAHAGGVTEVLKGDPFNLASGRVPYRMPRGRFSAAELATNSPGIRPGDLNYVFK